MLLLTLNLLGCQRVITKDRVVLPDDNLLYHPCERSVGFQTTRQLATVNAKNRGCVDQYKVVIDKLIEWKKEQALIYKVEEE